MRSRSSRTDHCLEADEEDEIIDVEWADWWCEEAQDLLDRGDGAGYVAHCRARYERDREDLHALEALAEAYLRNGQPEEAIALVEPAYVGDPANPVSEPAILEALVAQGRSIADYPWRTAPRVVRLDGTVIEACCAGLRRKRKPVWVLDLTRWLVERGFLLFSVEELLAALKEDGRFVVHEAEGAEAAGDCVRRG